MEKLAPSEKIGPNAVLTSASVEGSVLMAVEPTFAWSVLCAPRMP